MNCERVKELFADALAESLDDRTKGALEAHLGSCPQCRDEIISLQATWAKLSYLPEHTPSPALDERVQTTIEAYRAGMQQAEGETVQGGQTLLRWFWSLWPRQPAPQFATAALLFALGFFLGPQIMRGQRHASDAATTNQLAIAQLREEIANMKQLLTLSLLEQPSASERLRGVQWTSGLDQPDVQVLSVLLRILELDPNVNVRLAALETLQQFHDYPRVRKGLIDALERAQSPLVQIDLINAMVRANAKDSVTAIKALLQNSDTDPTVRESAEWALQKLS